MRLRTPLRVALVLALLAATGTAHAQNLNFDFGAADDGPPATYGAAGQVGHWNSFPAAHGTNTSGMVDVAGLPTAVSVSQIGGFTLLVENDPSVTGDDALLLDDFLVTYSSSLESCLYLNGMAPGTYEVLIYARMPDSDVLSYTSVDQEPGFPHWSVGGVWPGQHAVLISYSRHYAVVGPSGDLDLHSGVVPAANPALGAALNGLQVRRVDLFADGFENADTTAWSATFP